MNSYQFTRSMIYWRGEIADYFSTSAFWVHYKYGLLLLLSVIVLSMIIDFLLSRSFLGPRYRLFLAPGVIIHELSHSFACLLTGAKVTELSVFEAEGGHVTHSQPKIPIIGTILISFAPLLFGIFLIYILSLKFGIINLQLFTSGISRQAISEANSGVIKNLLSFSLKNWLIFYLTISIAVTMNPSRKDIANSIGSFIVVLILFVVISSYFKLFLPIDQLSILLFSVLNVLILILIPSMILFVISKLLVKTT